MSNQAINKTDLMNAFFNAPKEEVIVKAEDLGYGSGLNFKEIFFEPQIDKIYRVRLVKNIFGPNITHRKIYKSLPDPSRRGKSFKHISSGKAETDPVLNLFFELYAIKKANNELSPLAELKIKEYLSSTSQACTLVQIVSSNDEDVKEGDFRLFVFSTAGQNSIIANLINEKVNPTQAMLEDGVVAEDLWDITEASVLTVQCTEGEWDGRKGRDFTKTTWSPRKIGVNVKLDDGTSYTFSPADLVGPEGQKTLRPEALPAFNKLIEILNSPNLSVHNYFAYKTIDDPNNTEETNAYLKLVKEKVDKIVPIISSAKSIQDVQNQCTADSSSTTEDTESNKGTNIFSESVPEELQNSIVDTSSTSPSAANEQSSRQQKSDDDIINDTISGIDSFEDDF